eukprot:3114876-Rhodomonas_salina.2
MARAAPPEIKQKMRPLWHRLSEDLEMSSGVRELHAAPERAAALATMFQAIPHRSAQSST